ncbi:SHOCT domain-containing protein [Natrinema salsiterrestre]|uniref:SHOCT domain-containing protein n=1 Tax=Natrinema salsiterrestre TaxID=2950540 RepID=A0A9Q4Q2J9_9EURY|nr:SHOCT domain-containing protein [Natrinema salsiterrestre]MDF9746596.1 SHOCT domain-containing protein [Natrinema salsiterrestre]
MATGNTGGREYSLVELFAIKFVLADVLIIALLLLAGPVYAIAATALIVIGGLGLWYLAGRTGGDESPDPGPDRALEDPETTASETDPVTTLQERYAAGELSEAEFEAKLDRLIESNERADSAGVETDDLSLERRG